MFTTVHSSVSTIVCENQAIRYKKQDEIRVLLSCHVNTCQTKDVNKVCAQLMTDTHLVSCVQSVIYVEIRTNMDTKIFPHQNDTWFPFCLQDDSSTVMLATVLFPFKTRSLLDTCP